MLERTVREAFEKVKAGFGLPVDVRLDIYKTREEAVKARGQEIEESRFAFSDPRDYSVVCILGSWPIKNHSKKAEYLEGVLAEEIGHLEYDSTHEEMTAVNAHLGLFLHLYQFCAVSNGIEAGFGNQLFEFYKIATTKTKYVPASVSEIIGVFPALAALSVKYDTKKMIESYLKTLPVEIRKEAEKYSFLLDAKSYADESNLIKDWESATKRL
jgi:hypothetical protein